MANQTVYPFGTNGTLPAGYPIINDLTTGGADKALSAGMGVQLKSEISSLQQLEPKVNGLISELYTTVDVALTAADADNTYGDTYLNASGGANTSVNYNTYSKLFSEGGKIKYSINAVYLGIFIADTGGKDATKTKVAYKGDPDGTYTIPAGKYLFWDVLKSDPSKMSILVETQQVKDIVTDEDLQPIEGAITSLETVAEQIVTEKVTVTANGVVGSFSKYVDIVTDKPFRVSLELLSGKRTSNVDFRVSIYYSDAPDTGVEIKHNSVSFDESAYFYPTKETTKIFVYSSVGFDEASQVKITVEVFSNLWKSIYDQRKPWTGKKIVCFGDSITELLDPAFMSWPDHFARTTGAKVVNLALGGTYIKPRSYASVNTLDWAYSQVDILNAVKAVVGGDGSAAFSSYESGMQYIYENAHQLIVDRQNVLDILENARATDLSTVDALVLFAGFNDWSSGGNTKEDVFAALVELVQTVSSAYPNVQIYYCNPMPCFPENIIDAEHFTTQYTRGGISQETFCEKMNEIGGGNTLVNVFDSYHLMGINAYNGLFYYRSIDGVHPWYNTKTIGRKIGAWLNSKYCV